MIRKVVFVLMFSCQFVDGKQDKSKEYSCVLSSCLSLHLCRQLYGFPFFTAVLLRSRFSGLMAHSSLSWGAVKVSWMALALIKSHLRVGCTMIRFLGQTLLRPSLKQLVEQMMLRNCFLVRHFSL